MLFETHRTRTRAMSMSMVWRGTTVRWPWRMMMVRMGRGSARGRRRPPRSVRLRRQSRIGSVKRRIGSGSGMDSPSGSSTLLMTVI